MKKFLMTVTALTTFLTCTVQADDYITIHGCEFGPINEDYDDNFDRVVNTSIYFHLIRITDVYVKTNAPTHQYLKTFTSTTSPIPKTLFDFGTCIADKQDPGWRHRSIDEHRRLNELYFKNNDGL